MPLTSTNEESETDGDEEADNSSLVEQYATMLRPRDARFTTLKAYDRQASDSALQNMI